MPLPAFLPNDLLPSGFHPATEEEVSHRCVEEFPTSQTRSSVFQGLRYYRQTLTHLGVRGTQWIDGSFTDKSRLDPEDVDLVNFCEYRELKDLPEPIQATAEPILDGEESTKDPYLCHTFLIILNFPSWHPMSASTPGLISYWKEWFCTPQDYGKLPKKEPAPHRGQKGIIEMTF